jgi:hypothetical protein
MVTWNKIVRLSFYPYSAFAGACGRPLVFLHKYPQATPKSFRERYSGGTLGGDADRLNLGLGRAIYQGDVNPRDTGRDL